MAVARMSTCENATETTVQDIKTVQELLQHATVKMTLEVYAQAVTSAKRKAQSKVAGMLKAGTEAK
jgi:integrase